MGIGKIKKDREFSPALLEAPEFAFASRLQSNLGLTAAIKQAMKSEIITLAMHDSGLTVEDAAIIFATRGLHCNTRSSAPIFMIRRP